MAIIPLAEQTGMIGMIGEWVFREACLQVLDWQQRGLECQTVAVNFSSKHFFDPGFTQALADILTETGVNPGALEIEIAEQLLRQDAREGFAVIKRLTDTGLRVAIDDFGVGHSCIPDLLAAGITTVKIDHSLIKPLPESESCAAVASALIAMCRELGITSVAEGVESRAQLQLLRQQHCDQVQGFIYTEALPTDAFEAFLAEYVARTFEGVTDLEAARA
jgi:EAL domain-containing protein (putative c-di-GMP-specific phosphodiesterase class I)